MCHFKERVMILLCVVIIIDSERWYSATISSEEAPSSKANTSSLEDTQNHKQHYFPLSIGKKGDRPNKKWYFGRNNLGPKNLTITDDANELLQHSQTTSDNVYQHFSSLDYRVSLNNTSLTKPFRPKRKISKRCPSSVRPTQKHQNENHIRKGKFLEVFEVVQFEHEACTSSNGLEGTCLHEYDCKAAGGSNMGSCADGHGTCCIIQFLCDGTYSSPTGWFTNPDYPTPSNDRISCSITLDKGSVDIQQIRLDFFSFELLPPTSGSCEDDQFIVSGQNTNNFIPILCGINTGQHVYIEVGDVVGPVYLSVQTVASENRLYAIKVTQLSKSHEQVAPKGCLQYYTDANGYIESFNYRDISEIGIPRYPSYLNNLNYAVCIERAATSCSVTYTNSGEMQIPNYDTDGLPVIPPRQAGVEIFNCPSDWLLVAAVRLCGERLNDGSVLQDFSLDAPITGIPSLCGAVSILVRYAKDSGFDPWPGI
ncbi:uncharacterized protein [Epargyreus clarus]|uniref:uncharacterized protein n=1 Tax=Epargyreus clarus TaxID=520877 RepID=UPI003C2D27CC